MPRMPLRRAAADATATKKADPEKRHTNIPHTAGIEGAVMDMIKRKSSKEEDLRDYALRFKDTTALKKVSEEKSMKGYVPKKFERTPEEARAEMELRRKRDDLKVKDLLAGKRKK